MYKRQDSGGLKSSGKGNSDKPFRKQGCYGNQWEVVGRFLPATHFETRNKPASDSQRIGSRIILAVLWPRWWWSPVAVKGQVLLRRPLYYGPKAAATNANRRVTPDPGALEDCYCLDGYGLTIVKEKPHAGK